MMSPSVRTAHLAEEERWVSVTDPTKIADKSSGEQTYLLCRANGRMVARGKRFEGQHRPTVGARCTGIASWPDGAATAEELIDFRSQPVSVILINDHAASVQIGVNDSQQFLLQTGEVRWQLIF